jgi:glutamate formiminotransferase
VSCNVHDPFAVPLAQVVAAAQASAARHGAGLRAAELVGLAPEAALDGFPAELELKGFDEGAHVLEKALTSAARHHGSI